MASPDSSGSKKQPHLISGSTFSWYSQERVKQLTKSNVHLNETKTTKDHSKKEFVIIYVNKNETIELYSKWSGIKKEELLKLNPGAGKNGIKENDPFHLLLTSEELEEFNANRNLYQLSLQLESLKKPEIEKIITYIVKEKETITQILEKFPNTNLDLLEKINPGKYISNLRAGDVIKIPIITKNKGRY